MGLLTWHLKRELESIIYRANFVFGTCLNLARKRPKFTPYVGHFDAHHVFVHLTTHSPCTERPHHCCAPFVALSHGLEGQRCSPLPHSLHRLSPLLSAPSPSLYSSPERTSAMDGSRTRCRCCTARLKLWQNRLI
jgi:hypothetical protein